VKSLRQVSITRNPATWIVLGGLLLRVWTINWSLPELYEEAYPFSVAWKFWNWGGAGLDFNPHFFNYPALTFYLNFVVQAVHYLAGSITGAYPTLASFNTAYGTDPSTFIILGRLLSVLFDVGTMYFTYRIGEAVGGKSVGAIAAGLVAINPLHIRQAHLINVDTPLTFFTILALYLLYRLVNDPKPKWHMASKYTGVMLLVAFAVIVLVKWAGKGKAGVRPGPRPVLAAFLSSGVVFLALDPYALLNLKEFLADVGFERYHAAYGHLGIDASQSTMGFYFLNVLPDALGIPLIVALLSAIVLIALRRESRMVVPLLFAAAYLAGIGLWEMRAERYLLPVVPVFILIASYGITAFAEMIRSRPGKTAPQTVVLGAIVLVAAVLPAGKTWTYQRSYENKDTRTIAKELIAKNLPGGSALVVSPMGINPGTQYYILNLPFNPVETERLTPFYDTRWYSGFDLAVLSDYDYARYEREPERFRDILRFYRELKDGRRVVAEVAPGENQNGPKIWMVALRGQEDATPYPPELFADLSRVGHDETVLAFLYNLSELLFAKDRLPKCRQVVRAGLAIAPGDARFLTSMAWTCFRMGDYPAASNAVDDALKAQPDRPEMISLKGSILLKLDRYDEAERFLLTALSMNDRLLSAYIDLSEVYVRQRKSETAIGTLDRVKALVAPGSPEARFIEERIAALRTTEKK
jgi:4-amino-4-deoxy-L-arabinose transferase-like glycosyltransferase/tetratricopeptide (TPR) repeat protein